MIAKTLVVKEQYHGKKDQPIPVVIKHDLSGFGFKDRLCLKAWKPVWKAKRALEKNKYGRYHGEPNFNRYIWAKESLLLKSQEQVSQKKRERAAAFVELGAKHMMDIHQIVKNGNYEAQMGVIVPAIALDQYINNKRIALTPERIKRAAAIAVELANTFDKYHGSIGQDEIEGAMQSLVKFLKRTEGMEGIGKEVNQIQTALEKGSPVLDKIYAKEAVVVLMKQGDNCEEECRSLILHIKDAKIRDAAIKNAQGYWDSYWWATGVELELFPKGWDQRVLISMS